MSAIHRVVTACVLALALVALPWATTPAWARYVLDYGDTIAINVANAPQYNYNGAIRPDGMVTLPVLGDVDVRGLSTDQLRDRVRDAVAKVVREPLVSITVIAFRPRSLLVFGEVTKPGQVDITRPDFTLIDVIAAAGGFTPHALTHEVTLLRGNGATARRYVVDVATMIGSGELTNNLRVEPGDRVHVARSPWPTLQDAMQVAQGAAALTSFVVLLFTLQGRFGSSQGQ